ncbi:sulfotransferase [Roseobacter sp. YSTF-M11]|uniref:Sulfotransferase n=1 Tax=Roseobacter insulae TaxID=2859783 RepID=A0A9X1G025_9RHOB|nr:sulfotransferase [Roseobacter insulae]MBW4710782.1 sulfotransferase [Roseobacter insulae]
MTDIIARTLSHAPVDTTFIAGRWHPSRASLGGIWTEARVWASSLVTPENKDIRKFLIFSRARSGSTLLTQLLNAHPDVRCGRELMSRRVLFPGRYFHNLARKSPTSAYGAKLLSYQMVQVQKLRNPVGFLDTLSQDGFQFIHLERQTFSQTLSLAMAQTSRVYHQKDSAGTEGGKKGWTPQATQPAARTPVTLDIDDFIRRLEWSDMLLEYERHCLRDFPHLKISYETDLLDQTRHQAAADQVFDWIGMPSAPVSGGLRKILPSDPAQVIANYDDLVQRVAQRGLEHLLPA